MGRAKNGEIVFKRLFGHSKTLQGFGLEVSHDDIYAFYEQLSYPQELAHKYQLKFDMASTLNDQRRFAVGSDIQAAFWAAFSDGEIDIPLDAPSRDRQSSEIFGSQVSTQGSFYHALQDERRKVEYSPDKLSPAFEILQLHWGAMLAKKLAAHPDELDRLGFFSRIQRSAVAFAPIISNLNQDESLTLSEQEQISPLGLVIEIDPGIRGAFAIQRQYDGQLASPWKAQPFTYWTIHRNDFHAQFLSEYLDAYGAYLFNFWSKNKNDLASLYLSTNLPEYLEYGESLGSKKDFGRMLRQDGGFACLKGNPADEINKIVTSHKERGEDYEMVDLVLWTNVSVLHESEQNLAATLNSVHAILRPNGGILVGAPLLQKTEDTNLAMKKVATLANDIFGKPNVRNILVGNTNNASHIPIAYIFMRK